MATIADSLVDRNQAVIREEIGRAAVEFMSDTSPIFRDMILESMEVAGKDVLGRDLRIKRRFYGSLTGVIEGGNVHNHVGLYGDATQAFGNKMFLGTQVESWPNPLNGPNPTPYGLTMRLHSVLTDIALSLSMLQLEAIPANIKQHLVPLLRGFSRNIAIWAANGFYADATQQYRLGSLGPSTGTGAYALDGTAFTITFEPTEKSTHRFATGQSIDVFTDATTLANVSDSTSSRVRGFVGPVDDWTNKVTLQFDPREIAEDATAATFATWATTGNLAEVSYVVYSKTFSSGFEGVYGWRDWLKFGGGTAATDRILGANAITDTTDDFIDVTEHPEFKSGRYSGIGALNRNKFLGILSNVHRALDRNGFFVDTLLASEGIWLNIFEQQLARENVQSSLGGPQVGSVQSIGLQQGFGIVHEGRSYKGFTERFLEDGVLLGLRRQGNWSLVTPPDPAGTTRTGGLPEDTGKVPLVFVMKALGGASERFPLLDSSGNITEYARMPGYIRMQYIPTQQIPGFYMEGITSTRTFAD